MPPARKKNVCFILFDLKMERKTSLYILNKIVAHMQFQRKTECKMFLLHVKNGKNNVKEVDFPIELFSGSQFSSEINEYEVEEGNWLRALELSIKVYDDYKNDTSVINFQIIFITDLITPLPTNELVPVSRLGEEIDKYGLYLFIMGPEVEQNLMISYDNDVIEDFKFLSEIHNEVFVRKLLRDSNGVICGASFALDFLTFNCKEFPKQPWNTPLTFDSFQFPTVTKRILTLDDMPIKKAEGIPSKKFMPIVGDWDAELEEIPPENVINAYHYLNTILTVPVDVNESFKYKGNRMFKLVGFVDSNRLPEIYLEGGEAHRVEAIKDHVNIESFNNLVQAMINLKKYGLALRSYNNNNAPRLYVLIPKLPYQFLMVPHAERIEDLCYKEEAKPDPTLSANEDVKIFSNYFDYLNTKVLPLNPSLGAGITYNNCLNKFVEKLPNVEVPSQSIVDISQNMRDALSVVLTTPTGNELQDVKVEASEELEDNW